MFLLYHRKLQFGKKLFLVFLFAPEDFEDEEEEGEEDEEEEPEGADDNDFVDFRLNAFVFYIVNDVEDADGGSFVPWDGRIGGISWHDPGSFGIFFVGVDFFFGEKREDLESVRSLGVDVTFVCNGGATCNVAR